MKSRNIIELEAILDMAIAEIKKGGISPEDSNVILMSLIEDYKKFNKSLPSADFIKEKIEKYIKK
ncbi:MAG: hypothetical protein QM535_09410 [Limnohabitans sp.]|nr:hypothetical protein [Limnohabitans sp.]